MPDIVVTLAREAEAPACLALLPDLKGGEAELLIGRCDGAFAGAAALSWWDWAKPAGFPLALQVLPAWRRKGVGRSLVTAAASLASGETAGLWAMRPMAEDGAAAAFLRACGFSARRRIHHFIADVDVLLEHVAPLANRLRAQGRAPADGRIMSLADAPLEETAWLLQAEIGGDLAQVLQRLRRRAEAEAGSRRERSLVAMQGDRVAGLLLCTVRDGVGVVEAWVVAPGWRNGWAGPALLETILVRGRADAFEAFRFDCDETVSFTMKLARRCAADEVAVNATYYYPIEAVA